MKFKSSALIIAIIILFAACDPNVTESSDGTGTSEPPIGSVSAPTVYVAGYGENAEGIIKAKYWKDGVETELPDEGYGARAESIFFDGTNVYITGTVLYEVLEGEYTIVYNCAAYWKDSGYGITTVILDEAWTNNTESTANDIFVIDGDIYAVGYTYIELTPGAYLQKATLWKNGTETFLENKEGSVNCDAEAAAVYIDGSTIHIVGSGGTIKSGDTAIYWHGTEAGSLTREVISAAGQDARFTDITGNETGIYASGYSEFFEGTCPFYWEKDGDVAVLTGEGDSTPKGAANGIALDGSDVFTTGSSNDYAAAHFWENETPKSVAEPDTASVGNSIGLGGGHVYIAGKEGNSYDGYAAVYWECEKYPLSGRIKTTLQTSDEECTATSIFID